MSDLLRIPREESPGTIIAELVAALYALRDLTEASESIAIYPEGAVGLDDLVEAEVKAREVLARFDFGEGDA